MNRGHLIEENLFQDSQLEILTESEGKRGLWLEGPCVMADDTNRNGRAYPMENVCRPMVDRYNRDYIEERRAIGECEHPEYPFPKMSNAAVIINQPLHWQGKNAVGKLRVLRNGNGQVIESLAEAGYRLGVSTRGLGSATENSMGVEVIDPGFMLTAVDVVDKPSGQTCYVNAIRESVEWVKDETSGIWTPVDAKYENAQRISKNMDSANAEEFMKRFRSVLNHLS